MTTTTDRIKTIQDSKRRNRNAIIIGAGMTLIATAVFFILPDVVPLQQLKMLFLETTGGWLYGNPFRQLRFLGPAVGGFTAGYLAVDINGYPTWMTSMKYGAIAAATGVGLLYLAHAALIAVQYVSTIIRDPAINASIPHILDIFMAPLFFALPLIPIGLFEGLIAGMLGNSIRRVWARN